MAEPVLSKEQRVSIEAESHMRYARTGRDLVKSAIEITEQAVLQSPEMQRAIQDAERYRWLRSDENRFEGEAWMCNLAPESLDAAIDAAMEGKA